MTRERMPTVNIKYIKVGLVCALIVAGAVYGSTALRPKDAVSSNPSYTVARVHRGDIVRTIGAVGKLSPLTSIEVSSQISGLVTQVQVDLNSPVTKGQLLARIDSSTYQQQLRQRAAELDAARADYALARVNSQRLSGLLDQDIVSRHEFDEVEARLQQAKSNLAAAEAAIRNVRVDVERCSITSPIDGIVIYKQIEVGKTVVSSLNAPTLFTIVPNLTRMKIIASISEVDIGEVRIGQSVSFSVSAIPDRLFTGVLTQIRSPYTPSDQEQTQASLGTGVPTFDVAVELEDPDRLLRPGLSASISVTVERRTRALQIPNSALRVTLPNIEIGPHSGVEHRAMTAGSATVYRLPRGNRASQPEPVVIKLGTSDGLATEVLSGLTEGETVITGLLPSSEKPKRGVFGS